MNKKENKPALSGVERIVPQLRFPEFKDDGDWEESTLGKLGKIVTGKTPSTKDESLWNGKILFITPTDISDDKYQKSTSRSVSRTVKMKILPIGSIVYTCIASIGKIAITTKESITNQQINSVIPNKNIVSDFVYYLLVKLTPFIKSIPATSTLPIINKTEFSQIECRIPNPKEQQKIANCLSSLDEVITAETDKLDLLKDHKKGLLQQLFPAEGETKPKFRFPEFKNDGDWEEVIIDDYFGVCSSKRVLQKDWKDDGIPFYRTRELVSLSKNEPFGSEIYISGELFLALSKKYGIPKRGDFLVSGVGTLGIMYQVKESDKFYFKDGNVIWFKTGKEIVSDYFEHCFQTSFVQNQIFGQSSASTVGTFTISNALKTKFWKPVQKEEQQKIANCLSSVDDLIDAQSKKIQALKKHKKGLMQQLFPNVNELTI